MCGLSSPTLCDPTHYSISGSSLHGVFQSKILEWVCTPGDLPDSGIEPLSLASPALARGFFTICHLSNPWTYMCMFTNTILIVMDYTVHRRSQRYRCPELYLDSSRGGKNLTSAEWLKQKTSKHGGAQSLAYFLRLSTLVRLI